MLFFINTPSKTQGIIWEFVCFDICNLPAQCTRTLAYWPEKHRTEQNCFIIRLMFIPQTRCVIISCVGLVYYDDDVRRIAENLSGHFYVFRLWIYGCIWLRYSMCVPFFVVILLIGCRCDLFCLLFVRRTHYTVHIHDIVFRYDWSKHYYDRYSYIVYNLQWFKLVSIAHTCLKRLSL